MMGRTKLSKVRPSFGPACQYLLPVNGEKRVLSQSFLYSSQLFSGRSCTVENLVTRLRPVIFER